MDVHVVCCDYRGYADSSPGMPNETGVVQVILISDWLTHNNADL